MSAPRPRKASDDTNFFFDYNLHFPSRTIYLGNIYNENDTATDNTVAEYFLKGMHLLNLGEDPGDISIILNHWGGDEYHFLACYDAIALSRAEVTVTVYGAAMSMGSWILQAADHRVMAPNATLLLHYGTWGTEVENASEDRLASMHNEGQRLRRQMEHTYLTRIRAKNPAYTERDLRALLNKEAYIPAPEAVNLGLADEVLST